MPEYVAPDVWVKGGLLDRKHITAMGEAIWLYLYLQSIVRRTGEHAGSLPPGMLYQHQDAVDALGVPRRRVERWFATLTEGERPYVTVTRRRLGYELTITKYEDLHKRAAERRSRPATSGASSDAEIRQNAHSDTPNSVARYANSGSRPATSGASRAPTNKEARAPLEQTNRPTDQQEDARARELTEHQLIINAFYEGLGRDPFRARDYKQHLAAGAELYDLNQTPQDVRNCTKWMASNPWRRANGKPPTLKEVAAALPGWVEDGRPGSHKAPTKGGPVSGTTRLMNVISRNKAERNQRALTGS